MAKQSSILEDIPTIIGIIGMVIISTLYFMDPGWDLAVIVRNSVTLSLPFAGIIAILLMVRKHARNIARGEDTLVYDVLTIACVVVMVFLGLTGGWKDPTYTALNINISVIGTMAVTAAISISVFSPMIRIYRAKTPTMAFLILLSIIALMTYSPLGEIIHPTRAMRMSVTLFLAIIRMDILIALVGFFLIVLSGYFVLRGVSLRPIPTIEASIEAVRSCAEKGRPLLFDTGWTGSRISGRAVNLTTLSFIPATLTLLRYITEEAGKLGVRVISGTRNSVYRLQAQDYMQQGYAASGHPERYDPNDVRFYPNNTALVMSHVGLAHSLPIGAAVMIGGHSQTSCVVIYEALATEGAMIVAGEIWPNDNSMSALCADYMSFAEENVAIGAYLTTDLGPKGALAAEDIVKVFLIAEVILGGILFGMGVL